MLGGQGRNCTKAELLHVAFCVHDEVPQVGLEVSATEHVAQSSPLAVLLRLFAIFWLEVRVREYCAMEPRGNNHFEANHTVL